MKKIFATNPSEHPHGTPGRYNAGKCRCQDCKAAWAAYCLVQARKRGRLSRAQRSAAARMRLSPEAAARSFQSEPYYPDKADPITLRPTAVGLSILGAVHQRTGRDYDDIIERLLRAHGADITFGEDAPSDAHQ